ncbi:MAG: metallophosphoesterase [Saprospiraceae bacterium]|nr:metallophosphoesterase [Saprospiraceae bacterium]MBK8669995.1 metallophosphoesterase [Saprospiraceae bacterium]MBL0100382.1 metallophosphoesterase [Saprospiraceae bacterium]
MDRRTFLRNTTYSGLLLTTGAYPILASSSSPEITRLTILHTNDVHSRIEPFPMDGSKNEGLGGVAKRATLIKRIREEQSHVLLLDAGDIFQGTPYFNFFGGELELKLMSEMGYDAATIGNHDFDGGMDGLERQLIHANFPLLVTNYDFENTVLKGKTKPYKIFVKGGVKVGVFGVGIELKGLVPQSLYKDTVYSDPIAAAEKYAKILRHEEKCDYVICLSHLGYKYNEDKVSDRILAQNTTDIDLIIGGHTHTFLKEPERLSNKAGKPVLINQVGWAGIVLGRLDVFFERNKKGTCISCKNILVGAST